MSKQVAKTGGMAAKYADRGRQAAEAHRNDPVEVQGGAELPAGIEGGIAQLVECKFGIYGKGDFKGEYFFMAQAIVLEPREFEGRTIAGRRTQIGPEPICDTPKKSRATLDEHVAWVQNEMKKLGAPPELLGFDDLESTAAMLTEAAPYIEFRTWKSEPTKEYPNPRTQHVWTGMVKDYQPAETAAVEDNTEAAATPAKPAAKPAATKPAATAPAAKPAGTKPAAAKPQAPPTLPDDAESLAVIADDGDNAQQVEAQEKLAAMAAEAGVDAGEIESTESWAAVVELINAKLGETSEPADDLTALGESADGGDEEAAGRLQELAEAQSIDPNEYETWAEVAALLAGETPAEGEVWQPTKGDVYMYKPPGAKKPTECEVTAVFVDKQSANLKSLDDGKSYKAVPWSKFQPEA